MRNYIRTFDNEIIYLTEEAVEKVRRVLDNPDRFPGKFLSIKGKRLAVSSIKEISSIEGIPGSAPISIQQSEQFSLPLKRTTKGFWETVLEINHQRASEHSPWMFPRLVDHALLESGISEPHELFRFIDAEWEAIQGKKYNRPAPLTISR